MESPVQARDVDKSDCELERDSDEEEAIREKPDLWWWLPLIVWAPIVFFAEEARKAIVRRRLRATS
jgi:hypothetical protein